MFHFLEYGFMQRAYLAGSFIGALCAILGLFLVLRKLSLIGDGLSHVSFGAIALGLFLGFYPFYIAVPVAIAASWLILRLTEKAKMYGDAAVGIVSSVGIAGGVILAGLSKGFTVDLFSYLFGNILAIDAREVYLSLGLSLAVLLIIVFLYNELFSVTFDREYARLTGVKTDRMDLILTSLTAVSVVLAIKVVGIMLVSALLILPAVTALQLARCFRTAMLLSVLTAVLSVVTGITVSFFLDLPAGAVIVLCNAAFFAGALVFKRTAA